MATRNVSLAVDVAVDARKAAAGFDSVGASAKGMARDLQAAGRDVDRNVKGMAESVDDLGSNSSQAAGGLGDLGGALSMLPGPLGALGSGMELVAPAIMGVTGAADLLSLAMNSNVVSTVRAKAASIAKGVADKGAAIGTGAMTLATKALNLAMRANPIGLVITAVLLLTAGFVTLYKKSDTVRGIVDKVWGSLRTAGTWVADLTGKVVSFLARWSPLGIAIRLVSDNAGTLTGKVRELAGWLRDKLGGAADKVAGAASNVAGVLRNGFVSAVEAATAPVRALIGVVEDLVGWLSNIKVPAALSKVADLAGSINPFSGSDYTTGVVSLTGGPGSLDPRAGITAAFGGFDFPRLAARTVTTGGAVYVDQRDMSLHVTVEPDKLGMVDDAAVARRLQQLLDTHRRRIGTAPTFGPLT